MRLDGHSGSGSIDFKEMRLIMSQMYPMAPADLVRPALMSVRPFADAEGQIDLPSFQDAMATLMEFMLQKVKEGNQSAAPVTVKVRHHHHSCIASHGVACCLMMQCPFMLQKRRS